MVAKADTTIVISPNKLVIYLRERSSIWQMRYKVKGMSKWERKSTGERDVDAAKDAAYRELILAENRAASGEPLVTRRFKDVANLAIARMEKELADGEGKSSFREYIQTIRRYLIPAFHNKLITNIDKQALATLDEKRIEIMGKHPSKSTLLSHNAALNYVLDEAQSRGLITQLQREPLKARARKSVRRAAFSHNEISIMRANWGKWIELAERSNHKEIRYLLRDYVEMLLETGARAGKELLNVRWNQISIEENHQKVPSNEEIAQAGVTQLKGFDANGNEIYESDVEAFERIHKYTVWLTVDGKTGRRNIAGFNRTMEALANIALRVHGINFYNATQRNELLKSDYFAIRAKSQTIPQSLQKRFTDFLKYCDIEFDTVTRQNRVLYSLRHTYATFQLESNKQISVYDLAKHMGTSVLMIQKHYEHLQIERIIERFRQPLPQE